MNKEELESAFNETTDNAVKLLKENVELKRKYKVMTENAKTLAKRVDKAIEYIEYYCIGNLEYENKTHKKLLEILKGEDKE